MLRPLRIVRCGTEEDRQVREEVKKAFVPPDVPESAHPFLVSMACRYQRRGLNLAELVATGADGWQCAQRYYGEATDQFERWGLRWVQESMLIALHKKGTETGTPL